MYASLRGCRVKCQLGCVPGSWCVSQSVSVCTLWEKKIKRINKWAYPWLCVTLSNPSMLSSQQCWHRHLPLLQPCTDMMPPYADKNQNICTIHALSFQSFFHPTVEALIYHFNRTTTAQSSLRLYSLPINSPNIGMTSEASLQKRWARLLEFVSLLPGFHPPHYWIMLTCLPFAAHRRTKTAQSKSGSSV